MLVCDRMSKHPGTIRADADYKNALTLMQDTAMLMVANKIGGLPVVKGDQHVVGIITETDIFKAFVELLGQDKTIESRKRRKA